MYIYIYIRITSNILCSQGSVIIVSITVNLHSRPFDECR